MCLETAELVDPVQFQEAEGNSGMSFPIWWRGPYGLKRKRRLFQDFEMDFDGLWVSIRRYLGFGTKNCLSI